MTLFRLTLDFYMIEAKPENLTGDRTQDSDKLHEQLCEDGLELIAPHRSNRKRRRAQHSPKLRR